MNIEAVTKIIREQVGAWALSRSLLLGYDNLPFDRSEDALHARLTVQLGSTNQASLGANPRYRTSGVFVIRLFAPFESGEEELHQHADSAAQTFRTTTLDSVLVTRTPSVFNVRRAGKWWQVNVTCPWYSDVIG